MVCTGVCLGVLVAINSVWEIKKGKAKSLSTKQWEWGPVLKLTLKTVVTFVFLALMWSFWSSDDVGRMVACDDSSRQQFRDRSGFGYWQVWLVSLFCLSSKNGSKVKISTSSSMKGKMSFTAVASRTSVMAMGLVLIGCRKSTRNLVLIQASYIASLARNAAQCPGCRH